MMSKNFMRMLMIVDLKDLIELLILLLFHFHSFHVLLTI